MDRIPIRLLLTSAGSRSIEAVIDCLKPVRDLVYLIGTNSVPEFVSLNELDAAYIVPETSMTGEFTSRLLEIFHNEKPDIVINGRDEEVLAISQLCSATGTRFAGPVPEIAHIYSDKYETYLFCKKNNLPFIQTAFYSDEIEDLIVNNGFPIIVKQRWFGHASKNVFILNNATQVNHFKNQGSYIFQSFVAPPETRSLYGQNAFETGIPWIWNPANTYYNIDLLLGTGGQELMRCITEAQRKGSIIASMKLSDDRQLHKAADQHAKVLGANGHRGPLNIQGFLDEEGKFQVFEWNARFVGSAYGFSLLGRNMVMATLRNFIQGFDACDSNGKGDMLFRPMRYEAVPAEYISALKMNSHWTK